MIDDEGIYVFQAQSTFFVPQTIRTRSVAIGNHTIAKLNMDCINYHHTNHNVETCRSKKEEPTIVITKATTYANKPPKLLNYPCHICGIVGHKLTNYPRFNEMQSMFKDKGGHSIKSKPITEVKMVIASINMVDVNVTTRNKTSE